MTSRESKIAGISYRNWKDENDYQEFETLGNFYNRTYNIDSVINGKDAAKWIKAQENYDASKHYFVAEHEGKQVGIMVFFQDKETDGPYLFRRWMIIHPDWIETDLPSEMYDIVDEAILVEVERLPVDAKVLQRSGYEDNEEWRRDLLKSKGYEDIRYFFEMSRPIEAPIPERTLPEGLEIKPVDTKEKEITVIKADDVAFRDHFEHVPLTEEKMNAWMTDSDYNPELWKVAWDGDIVAGAVMNFIDKSENETLNRKRGYTEDITCQRPYRGKGVASALIAESIKMFKEMGMEETALSVDTINPSGALGLYESFGYKAYKRMVAMAKEIER